MSVQKPIKHTKWRHLYPFQSNHLKINGLNYHYIDQGTGEPIVMLHGNPTWSFYYRSLIKTLTPHYRVIVPDHMGCGLSDKPTPQRYDYRLQSRINDFNTLIDHLRINEKITLIFNHRTRNSK